MDVYRQKINVAFEYPVYFTHGVFAVKNKILATVLKNGSKIRKKALVYIDSGVAESFPGIIKTIKKYFDANKKIIQLVGSPVIVPGGENAKNGWNSVREVMTDAGNRHMDRQSYVIAVGGGSVLDMVGFGASLVHRGLRLIRIPTTVLAQNDAGVGVKNGMNEHGAKNFAGTFAPPYAVIDDLDFLKTLKDRDWRGGIAEAFKVAIIKDKAFLGFLVKNAGPLKNRNMSAMEKLVKRCAVLHLDHIRRSGDPFEMGSARPLDFGHWSAHQLELMSNFDIGHGQAVSIGMAIDSYYAMRKRLISASDYEKIINGLRSSGLPVWDVLLERKTDNKLELLEGLERFREHLGGELCVTLPDGLGRKLEVNEMDYGIIREAIAVLKKTR